MSGTIIIIIIIINIIIIIIIIIITIRTLIWILKWQDGGWQFPQIWPFQGTGGAGTSRSSWQWEAHHRG